MSPRIHTSEPDQALLRSHMTSMQRERADAPIADEFTGRWRYASWGMWIVVGTLFWMAVFAGVFA